jgi:hypothetical protein
MLGFRIETHGWGKVIYPDHTKQTYIEVKKDTRYPESAWITLVHDGFARDGDNRYPIEEVPLQIINRMHRIANEFYPGIRTRGRPWRLPNGVTVFTTQGEAP